MDIASIASLVEQLYGPLKPGDGIAQPSVATAEKRLGLRLPKILRNYHILAGNCQFNRVYYRLVRPREMRVRNGALVICRDNHRMVQWSVRIADIPNDDPPVCQAGQRGRADWFQQSSALSEFLAWFCCWQAVHGGLPFGAVANIDGRIDDAIAGLRGELTAMIDRPDTQVFAGPGRAAVIPPPGEHSLLYAAASTAEALQAIQRTAGLEWDDRWPDLRP